MLPDRRRRIIAPAIALAAAAVGGATRAAAQDRSDAAQPVPVDRLRDGDHAYSTYSGLADSARLVVRDSASWRRLWRELNRPFVPPPPLPSIDFAREMVVIAALGLRPSAGYDIVIEGATLDSSGLGVDVRRTSPAAGCPVLAVVTQPVDVARLPSIAAPTHFHERTVVIPCPSPH